MLPSYYDAIRPLPDEDRLALYDAIMDYAFAGKEPEDLSPILKGYFVLLRPNINSSARRYAASVENGKKGGRPRKEPSKNPAETQDKPSKNQDKDREKEKERELDTDMEYRQATPTVPQPVPSPKKKSRTRFVPPTLEEVAAYAQERGSSIDVQRFVDYYNSNGWRVGKNPMKDWRAAVRNWERRDAHGQRGENDSRRSGQSADGSSAGSRYNIKYDVDGCAMEETPAPQGAVDQ